MFLSSSVLTSVDIADGKTYVGDGDEGPTCLKSIWLVDG